MPISLRIGPLTTEIVANEVVLLERAVMPLAAIARITGRYSGRAPAITALTATFSTSNSQNSRNAVGRSLPTILSRAMFRALEHLLDAFLRRQDDRQEIRPAIADEQFAEVLLGVGLEQPRRRAVEVRHP